MRDCARLADRSLETAPAHRRRMEQTARTKLSEIGDPVLNEDQRHELYCFTGEDRRAARHGDGRQENSCAVGCWRLHLSILIANQPIDSAKGQYRRAQRKDLACVRRVEIQNDQLSQYREHR